MEDIDRKICRILQSDARTSSTDIAAAVGLSVSAANERVRKLFSNGTITAARAVIDGRQVAAGTCAYMIIDMQYEGEEAATSALAARPEVQEIHHVSGQHSYFVKLRIADTHALQNFLQMHVKPLKAIKRTETIFVLETLKETTEVQIADDNES